MFIDMGFILRNIFSNNAISSCYIVLPKIYQGYGKERVYANAYAAAKELEHYNLKNNFTVSWKKNTPLAFQPGVYDDVYLIDGENVKNLSLSDLSNRDIYKMLADSIFQDFANSDFANYKRGVRVNLVQYKQRLYPDDNSLAENTFSRKYSTLGQSTISIPVDRITLACSYKLCEDIINYYLSNVEGSQSDIDNYLMKEFLPSLGLLESNSKHQLLDSLYKSGENSSIQSSIKSFLLNLQNELVSGKRGDKWASFVFSEKSRFDTNFKDDNDIQRQGMFYSQIYDNRSNILRNIVGERVSTSNGNLERQINSLINDSTRGVFYALSLLRRFQFILQNENFHYIPQFEKDIKDLQARVTRLESEIKSRLQDLKEDESRSKLNVMRKTAMTGTLDKLIKSLDEYYNSLIKLRSRYFAKEVSQRILNLIEEKTKSENGKVKSTGLINDLDKLTGNLGLLKENFNKKYQYFIQKQESSFNLLVYEPDDVKNEYYIRYIGTGQRANDNIKDLAYKLLKELGASDVTDIINILKDSDASAVEKKMVSFAKQVFSSIREDYSVTDILFEKDAIRSESKIRGMIQQAYPWLRIKETPGSFSLDESAKKFYIGVKTNSPSFKKFQSLIYSITGHGVEFKDSADNTSITFYSEWAGFPLFYSYTISEEMKGFYKQLSNNMNIDLHNDKNYFIFNDIIPLTAEERRRLDEAHRAYLTGLIFGVFEIVTDFDNETGETKSVYKYTYQEGITVRRTEQLGIESRLINKLFEEQGREALRYRIQEEANKIQDKLISEGKLAEILVMLEYYYENIYKLQEIEVAGGAKTKLDTYEYRITRQLATELENKIPPSEKQNFVQRVNVLKNNLDDFSTLCGDGMKRVILIGNIMDKSKPLKKDSGNKISVDKLKDLKAALDIGLISSDEYESAKQKFLDN
jgi:hypothetical protein